MAKGSFDVDRTVAALAITMALATMGIGCQSVECTSEITQGAGTFKGSARGKPDDTSIRRRSAKDACIEMCLTTKSAHLDNCSSRCIVDAEAGKIGVKTTCSDQR